MLISLRFTWHGGSWGIILSKYCKVQLLLLQVVNAADEIINSVNREELAKYFSQKSDPEDDSAEVSSNYYWCDAVSFHL